MANRESDRTIIYLRCSHSGPESGIRRQLESVVAHAKRLGVALDATLADLDYMQARGLNAYKDIVLESGITSSEPNGSNSQNGAS